MASLTVRVRGPAGQATVSIDAAAPLSQFQFLVAEKTGVPAERQQLCGGFPPAPLALPDGATAVAECPIQNGDVLIVKQVEAAAAPAAAPAAVSAAATPAPTSPCHDAPATAPTVPTSPDPASLVAAATGPAFAAAQATEDAELARAIALSLAEAAGGAGAGAGPSAAAAAGPPPATVPAAARPATGGVDDTGNVVRRVIDSDNSCLFNAVGYVMERSRTVAPKLRRVIADTVAADPITYSEAMLGKPNAEYCAWILDSQKWGGAIELSILSKHYEREIAAYDIQTTRCDCYGQGEGYSERAMLIYDGLHYDALAVECFPGAPEEVDLTVFPTDSPLAESIGLDAARMVSEAHKAKKFTDTANFTLRCGVCQKGFVGQKEAVAHAKETGHSNFSEY